MEATPSYGDPTAAGARPRQFRWAQSPPVEDSDAFLPMPQCAFGAWATAASRSFDKKVMGLLERTDLLSRSDDDPGGEPLCEEDRWLLEGFLANAVDGLAELDTIEAFGILSRCRGDTFDPANPADLSAIVVRDFALQFEFAEERRPAGAVMSGGAHA